MPLAPLVYVMGPSGAGKDSLLRFARTRVAGIHPIAFAHRYITRPPTPGDENHIALSEPEFDLRRSRGLFAMDWRAHGLRYGIGIEIDLWRKAGFVVVVSGSRAHFAVSLETSENVVPVLITATASMAKRCASGFSRPKSCQPRIRGSSRSTTQGRSSTPAMRLPIS
jgi:ribose 1,5-bisphosphokinase